MLNLSGTNFKKRSVSNIKINKSSLNLKNYNQEIAKTYKNSIDQTSLDEVFNVDNITKGNSENSNSNTSETPKVTDVTNNSINNTTDVSKNTNLFSNNMKTSLDEVFNVDNITKGNNENSNSNTSETPKVTDVEDKSSDEKTNTSENSDNEDTKEINIKKYLSNSKELTDEEIEQFAILNDYAPWLFDPEKMNYKKYSGYDWYYDYNGYNSYDDLLAALEKNGLTTDDIDNSLPDGVTVDWDKVKSAYSKEITNMDIALSLDINGKSYGAFYSNQTMSDFLSRIEFYTEEELKVAYEKYSDDRTETFDEYIDSMEGTINQREGMIKALRFLSTVDLEDPDSWDYIQTHFKGLEDGLDQYAHGMDVFLSPHSELSKTLTSDQYEAVFIASLLAQSNSNVETILGDFNGLEKVYTLSMAEGNMIPSMTIGTLGSVFGLEGLGAFSMFCSVSGNNAESAYRNGYDLYSSWVYGYLTGASEATLEYVLGGIPGVSAMKDKSFLVKIFSEGVEESLQEVLDPYIKYMITGEDPVVDWDKVKEAGIDGIILAAYLNGGEVIIGTTSIGSETLDFLQNNYQHFKSNDISGQEILEVLDYINNGELTINQYEKIMELESKGEEVDYSKLGDSSYVENLLDSENDAINLGDLSDIGFDKSKIMEVLNEYGLNENDASSVCDLIMETEESVDYDSIAEKLNTFDDTQLISFFSIENQIKPEIVNELFSIENNKAPNERSDFINNLTSNLVENVLDYYEEAQVVGSELSAFKTYRTHTEGHVQEVADRSIQAATSLENSLTSEYDTDLNFYELYVAAIWHDIGMGASEGGYIKGIDSQYNKKTGDDAEYDSKILEETDNGNVTRSNHALNSALTVLENSSYFNSIGLDANIVALLTFAHTKSNSGIKDISNSSHWDTAIKILDESWTKINEGTEYTGFIDGLVENGVIEKSNDKYIFTSKYRNQIYAESYALRFGDANTNNTNLKINQAGEQIDIKTNNPTGIDGIEDATSIVDIIKSEYEAVQVGVDKKGNPKYGIPSERVEISIDNKSLSMQECDPITVAFIVGEDNINFSTSNKSPGEKVSDGRIHEVFEIQNSNVVGPTMFNISERIGEVVTGTSLLSGETAIIDVVFPEGTSQEIIDFYISKESIYGFDNADIRFCYYVKEGNNYKKVNK